MNRDIALAQEGLLRAKQLYEDILLVTIQQKQLMDAEDEQDWPMEAILDLQNKRQQMMQQIDELDSAEGFITCPDPQQSGNNVVGRTGQMDSDNYFLQETMAQIHKTILDIQTIELSCQAKMEEARQTIKGKITRTRENKKAQVAYNQRNSYESAWFIDKKR